MDVFLDTQVFISENYTKGIKLRTLAKYGNLGYINLKITNVTHQEILANIKKDTIISISALSKLQRDIGSKAKILKNLDLFHDPFYHSNLEEEESISKIENVFQNFIDYAKIEIVNGAKFDLVKLLSRYFNELPPFSIGKKKYEFPDAISTQIVEEWALINNKEVIFLSGDSDIKNIQMEFLDTTYTVDSLINEVIRIQEIKIDSKEVQVREYLKSLDAQIQNVIKDQIIDDIGYYVYDIYDTEDIEVEDVDSININSISFEGINFIEVEESYVSFNYRGKINFDAVAFTYDKSEKLIESGVSIRRRAEKIEFTGGFEAILHYYFEYDYTPYNIEIEMEKASFVRND